MASFFVKNRPESLAGMVGNEAIRDSVGVLLARKKSDIPHAWLFAGNSGVGKTTIARIIASSLGATPSSTLEINAASARGIDAIREIINSMEYLPLGAASKCYIIDECHQLTKEAQNALLKPLEDTPLHTFFILLTTSPGSLLPSIKNRCKSFTFKPVPAEELEKLGREILQKEGLVIPEPAFIHAINSCGGSPRLFLNMIETASTANTEKAAIESIDRMQSGILEGGNAFVVATYLFDALKTSGSQVNVWSEIAGILDSEVYKPHLDTAAVRICLANKIHSYLLRAKNNNLGRALEIILEHESDYGNSALTCVMYKIVKEIANDR